MIPTIEWITEQTEISSTIFKQTGVICANEILSISTTIIKALDNGNKVLWCGNGGSAGQAQHLSTELVCGLRSHNRPALASISLTTDTSLISAWSNDIDYKSVFSRQVEALGKSGDIMVALSTSGNSKNVIEALKTSKNLNILTIGFSGTKKSQMKDLCDFFISIPSDDTQRIQEGHILVGHIICEIIEDYFMSC